jgi:hypothetical protein
MIRILIVDDHDLLREAIQFAVNDVYDVEVVGVAGTDSRRLGDCWNCSRTFASRPGRQPPEGARQGPL